MKSLRRSLNSGNHHHGQSSGSGHGHGPSQSSHSHSHSNSQGNSALGYPMGGHGPGFSNPLSRPTDKVAPPQKVIKALNSHRSTNPQELSYTKGDFWYVIGEREGWYEALNTLTNSRGLVPKDDFEEFSKGGRQASAAHSTSPSSQHTKSLSQSQTSNGPMSPTIGMSSPLTYSGSMPGQSGGVGHGMGHIGGMGSGSSGKKHQPLYAIVQYDFHAERPDELEAKAGEPIVVIAQSNHEWFVAKPIGRLGGPGLIPVAFVEIRDPVTTKPVDVFPSTIPQVEEWKKATAEYKAAAIPLGRLDVPPDQRVTNSPFQANNASSSQGHGEEPDETSTMVTSSTAGTARGQQRRSDPHANNLPVPQAANGHRSYKPEQDPMLPPGELIALRVPSFHNESGIYWFRLHAAFLSDDPKEPAYTLILYRTYEDFYDFQITLLDTFPTEAGRSSGSDQEPPRRLLPYMPGPVDDVIDDQLTEYRREELDSYVQALLNLRNTGCEYILRDELIRTFFAAKYGDYCEETPRPQATDDLPDRMASTSLDDHAGSVTPAASGQHAHKAPNHTGGGNGWTFPKGAQPPPQPMRTGPGPPPARLPQAGHIRNMSSISNNINNLSVNTKNAQLHGNHGFNPNMSAVTPVMPGVAPTVPSQPVPPLQHNAPAQTPAGPRPPPSNAAFVKIKIYDRATDDLIALRVHPAVTYAELLDKVRARLGPDISVLQYRVGGGGPAAQGVAAPCRQIQDDRELSEWMAGEDKLVLYAEQA